jgi:Zn-finger nucleic acid-binding protein
MEGSALPCPVDGQALSTRSIGTAVIRSCGACHGLWIPGEQFEQLIAKLLSSVDPTRIVASAPRRQAVTSTVVYRPCPECGDRMQRKNYGGRSGVIIDWCGRHGTWLDADELESIASYLATGGTIRPAVPVELTDAVREPARAAGGPPDDLFLLFRQTIERLER